MPNHSFSPSTMVSTMKMIWEIRGIDAESYTEEFYVIIRKERNLKKKCYLTQFSLWVRMRGYVDPHGKRDTFEKS